LNEDPSVRKSPVLLKRAILYTVIICGVAVSGYFTVKYMFNDTVFSKLKMFLPADDAAANRKVFSTNPVEVVRSLTARQSAIQKQLGLPLKWSDKYKIEETADFVHVSFPVTGSNWDAWKADPKSMENEPPKSAIVSAKVLKAIPIPRHDDILEYKRPILVVEFDVSYDGKPEKHPLVIPQRYSIIHNTTYNRSD
jgi:hypothetical protein